MNQSKIDQERMMMFVGKMYDSGYWKAKIMACYSPLLPLAG
jgi:hypothetical protein